VTARPDPDLFDRDAFGLPAIAAPIPDEVVLGLAKLAGGPPLWGNEQEWCELMNRMRAWTCRWHGPATAAGWGGGARTESVAETAHGRRERRLVAGGWRR
jgi:hypothetical protein